MNATYFIPIIMLLLIVLITQQNERAMMKKFITRKRGEERKVMQETAKRFIDKECIIYTFNSQQLIGFIREVNDGAILLDNKGSLEAVNLEFVTRIREYPRNKNGKKKSIVAD
ncbi:MAG: hypothetical protein E7653_00250 [Ruminococcaceae bacterium]|nr:hypothetical protein [Oscillospiraceae bacterium]